MIEHSNGDQTGVEVECSFKGLCRTLLSTERDSDCKVCTFVKIELHRFIEHFASCGVVKFSFASLKQR